MTTIIGSGNVSSYSKTSVGNTDISASGSVYKFLGASLVGLNSNMGFNGSASTVSLQLVEDTADGDLFTEPDVPFAYAVSLPSGGVNTNPLATGQSVGPTGFDTNNFYFAGICTSWTEQKRSARGKTISVNISDPRELMGGIVCLLNGFALTQAIGTGSPRNSDVDNIIDIFGYYNYGLESDRNEFGMEWSKIKDVIEAMRVSINGINMEFYFTGDTFTNVPSYYRIPGEQIDLLSLVRKVATDGGSDFITVGRKVASNTIVVEIRGIRRTEDDVIKKTEIDDFVNARSGIVEYFDQGKEYRPEATSSIIVGGAKNANYVAKPSNYVDTFHFNGDDMMDYDQFPDSIIDRLIENASVDAGAIYPFWGFAPSGTDYPMMEPYISFDHISLDFTLGVRAYIKESLPQLKITPKNYTVRVINHDDVFLNGDGDSDSRPFGYVDDIIYGQTADEDGYIRGLPLNTEVLKFALVGEYAFWSLYSFYYPDAAEDLDLPSIDFGEIIDFIDAEPGGAGDYQLASFPVAKYFDSSGRTRRRKLITAEGVVDASDVEGNMVPGLWRSEVLREFKSYMYKAIRKYAEEHLGRKFMVVLPKSEIMQRIWSGQDVPTRPERPEIEYIIDSYGFWENTPADLDGFQNPSASGSLSADEEEQIRRRFMGEDGRFQPMVAVDIKPSGNSSFYSTGTNRALFQDMDESDFRPNIIADKTNLPPYVFVAPSRVSKISERRPDLALVALPTPIQINPTDTYDVFGDSGDYNPDDDITIISKQGVSDYLLRLYKKDSEFRRLISTTLPGGSSTDSYLTNVIRGWSDSINSFFTNSGFQTNLEFCMDLRSVVIPLTSNWTTYGPWYSTNAEANGKVDVVIDDSLVPWNFNPNGDGQAALSNMDTAGEERLARSVSTLEYLDRAKVTVAGFPEFSLGYDLGFNSNVTSINITFGIGGIKSTYTMSSFSARPGTFRKSDFDDLSRVRIDTRPPITNTDNVSLVDKFRGGSFRQGGFSYNTDRFY